MIPGKTYHVTIRMRSGMMHTWQIAPEHVRERIESAMMGQLTVLRIGAPDERGDVLLNAREIESVTFIERKEDA